ncbi:Cytochrome C biogenesis protein [uncultured archaeon]|nr:Cytochrome C biogenesis protein [uncultured archaeon]
MSKLERTYVMKNGPKIILFIFFVSLFHQANTAMADEDMTSHLICPCECAMIISTCDCSTAIQVKKEINQMKESGFSEKQIFSALQAEYGIDILMHPEKDNPIPVWLAGIPLVFIFVFLGYIMARKPNPDIIPVTDKKMYEQRFEEEYRKFVSDEPEDKEEL